MRTLDDMSSWFQRAAGRTRKTLSPPPAPAAPEPEPLDLPAWLDAEIVRAESAIRIGAESGSAGTPFWVGYVSALKAAREKMLALRGEPGGTTSPRPV